MTEKRTLQAQYDFLVLSAIQDGLASHQEWERTAIALMYVKEVRKGSFLFAGNDDQTHVQAFLEHLKREFVDSVDVKVALDFQPRLLATAQDLSHRPHPIEAVILYATWCEHWLNATLISAAFGRGLIEKDVMDMIRSSSGPAKLGWLWRMLCLPVLPSGLRSAVEFLSQVRNEHVHYKWTSHDPDTLTDENSRLKLAIAEIKTVVEGLIDFEIASIVGPHIAVANRLFSTDIGPEWRELALARPMSAPRLTEESHGRSGAQAI
jgi:hypothetical protein